MGVSTIHKGYKCLNKEDIIFISKDVVVNETEFPYNDLHSQLHNPDIENTIQVHHIFTLSLVLCRAPQHVKQTHIVSYTNTTH